MQWEIERTEMKVCGWLWSLLFKEANTYVDTRRELRNWRAKKRANDRLLQSFLKRIKMLEIALEEERYLCSA